MKTKFICQNHRSWLQERPTETLEWWANSFESGKKYQDWGMWEESIPSLGCAFDAASINLEQQVTADSDALERFSKSALSLTYSLLKLGESVFAEQIVDGVQARFSSFHGRNFDRQRIHELLRKLHLLLAAYPAQSLNIVEGSLDGSNALIH